jgi:hypothetical protein
MTTRVNAVGWVLVLFFLAGGVLFWITIPEIFIGQIWVAVSAFLAFIYAVITARGRAAARLRRDGLPGRATILEMTQTGTYVNQQPLVKLKLRIEGTGIEPFETEKRIVVPLIALGTLSNGRPLTVFVDPHDHEEFTIDWSAAMAQPQPANVAAAASVAPPAAQREEEPLERLTKLMELKNAQAISDEEFAEQRKRILDSI